MKSNDISSPSLSNIYFLIEVKEFYDKSWIVIDKFITQSPNKFKDTSDLRYSKEKINKK